MELEGGVWSSEATNPLNDHFRVRLHHCSSDDYSGSRGASAATGGLHFQGSNILTAVLQDLVATFGINRAESLVLAGTGAGARGVGHSCDYVAAAVAGVSNTTVRCVADGGDMVPWWVHSQDCEAGGRRGVEARAALWGRQGDRSCLEENQARHNSSELAQRCGLWSRYWSQVSTPVLLLGSHKDLEYFNVAPCVPREQAEDAVVYQLAWQRGVVAVHEAVLAGGPEHSVFLTSCSVHGLLGGGERQGYFTDLQVCRKLVSLFAVCEETKYQQGRKGIILGHILWLQHLRPFEFITSRY